MWKAAWLAAPVFIAVVVGWFSPWNASLHDDTRLASSTATGPSLEALLRPSPPLACGELDALLQGAASAQAAFEAAVTAWPMEVGRARCLLARSARTAPKTPPPPSARSSSAAGGVGRGARDAAGLDLAKHYPTLGGRGRGRGDLALFPEGAPLLALARATRRLHARRRVGLRTPEFAPCRASFPPPQARCSSRC